MSSVYFSLAWFLSSMCDVATNDCFIDSPVFRIATVLFIQAWDPHNNRVVQTLGVGVL